MPDAVKEDVASFIGRWTQRGASDERMRIIAVGAQKPQGFVPELLRQLADTSDAIGGGEGDDLREETEGEIRRWMQEFSRSSL